MTLPPADTPVLVKRYAATRLYDTVAAQYRTVGELRRRAAEDVPFGVAEAATGEDITRVLLA